MKRFWLLTVLVGLLLLAGCNAQKESHGIPLPYSLDQVETIELIHHTGDPSMAQQKWITDAEDIHYIYNLLSAEILISNKSTGFSNQTDTLYITFHHADGTGCTVKFQSFGVKNGIISSADWEDFSYFTPSDICWVWGQLARDYEAQPISIEDDPYAEEEPVAIGYDT